MSKFGKFKSWIMADNERRTYKESQAEESKLKSDPGRAAPPDPETDPTAYPEYISKYLLPVPETVSEGLAREASILSQLGCPIPTPTSPLKFVTKMELPEGGGEYRSVVRVQLPQFKIPDCLDIRVRNNLHYFIAGSKEYLEPAKAALAQHGLIYLIEHYPGIWVNRYPYHFYKKINESEPLFYMIHWFTAENFPSHGCTDPLTKVPGLTTEDIKRVEQRIKTIETLSQKIYPFHGELIKYSHDPGRSVYNDDISDDLIFHSKIPDEVFPADCISFKVLPSKEVTSGVTLQWLESLRQINDLVCFELKNEPDTIYYQLSVSKQDASIIEQNFELYFPDFALLPLDPSVSAPPTKRFCITARPSLSHEFLKSQRDFSLDPYLQLFSLFDKQTQHEGLQIFFAPLQVELMNAIFDSSEEEVKRGTDKKKTPWIMALKLYSDDPNRIEQIRQTFLSQFETTQQIWDLSPVQSTPSNDRTVPPWNLVATSEMASLVHFPGNEIKSDRLEQTTMKAKLPPENFTSGEVLLGESSARGQTKPVAFPNSVRDRHLYIVGKSGMGKSTLIANAVIANMRQGEGCCVIDPHGDLIASGDNPLLDYVPEGRIRDTIYFNAADKEYPLALNMLSAHEDDELSLLADNLLVTFRRLSDASWGPRMDDILRATLQTLMYVPGTTFLDIKRILHNEDFRASITKKLTHPMLREFWEEDFPRYSKDASSPIVSRVNKFLYLPQLYSMLSSVESKLDFYDVINNKKILLVNLASGSIGEDNAQLIGSMIVTQLQMAIMRRANIPPEQRTPFYLYVDEFQNFTTSSFEKILSEARKYKLCLTLAHQFISQLPDSQRDAIFGNVGTMVMFSCGDKDANALRYQLGSFDPQDLVNLRKYEALCRPETAQDTFLFKTNSAPEKPRGFAQAIIKHTREHYSIQPGPDSRQASAAQATRPDLPQEQRTEAAPPSTLSFEPLKPARTPEPARAPNLSGLTREDKVVRAVAQAGYLSTQQIIELCFGDYSTSGSKKKNASLLLSKLEEQKQITSLLFEREKLWYVGKKPNVRRHDLGVRDIYTYIVKSGYKIAEVKFYNSLQGSELLNPDLSVEFAAEDGSAVETFWEFDNNSEGDEVLLSKFKRYLSYFPTHKIVFVFSENARIKKLANKLSAPLPPIYHTTLELLEKVDAPQGAIREPVFGLFSLADALSRVRLFE